MKVLHIISTVDPRYGGPIEGVFASSEVWRRHGHQRHIVCLDPPDAPWVAKSPVPIFAVGLYGPTYRFLRRIIPWLRYGYTPRLEPWLKSNVKNYDAVIVNGLWNFASYGAWLSLHNSNTPYFVFTHGMLDPWFNKAYPLKTFFKTGFWKLFENKVLRDARGVLFTCDEERRLAARSFAPYRAREFVVGYGARRVEGDEDAQRAAFRAKVPDLRDRDFILFLSRIHPKKGVDLLIEAFARQADTCKDLDLVIAGPDQVGDKAKLQKRAKELGIDDRIHWPGMLSGDAKWGAFQSARFFALPSHQENFGIVVAEALSKGAPLLITNKVNIWREVEEDGGGIVVDDTIEGVADGLARMCALSDDQLATMSSKGKACFSNRYDLETNAISLLNLMREECHV